MYGSLGPQGKDYRDKLHKETDSLISRSRHLTPPLLKKASTKKQSVAVDGNSSVLDTLFSGPRAPHVHHEENLTQHLPTTTNRKEALKQTRKQPHSFTYTLLNPRSRQWQAVTFKSFVTTIIVADLTLFILSTDEAFNHKYLLLMYFMEGFVSCIFLVEYVARLVTITEKKKYSLMGPMRGRLCYMLTTAAAIDALATVPFFLEICTGWNLPTLTYLRCFRLLRILKTQSSVRAFDAVYRVIYFNQEILHVAVMVCGFLILITAVLLYYLGPSDSDSDQDEENFSSIPSTLYLATLMLTGQGGPEGELPWYTKCVILLTSMFSVAMFAIPASMLTWGFEAEATRCAKLAWRQANKQKEGKNSNNTSMEDTSSSSSSSDGESRGNSTDEEYFRLIAGAQEEDEEDEEDVRADEDAKAWLLAQKKAFRQADADGSGEISMKEYILMANQAGVGPGTVPAPTSGDATCRRRLQCLEEKVKANGAKLDRILELLEQK